MVQRTVVVLEDDLDGGEAVETVVFALDGGTYEIDLNENNAARMRDKLASYVGAARRAGRPVPSRPTAAASRASSSRKAAAGSDDSKAVRAWADANGVTVSARGRLSAAVLEQYRAAVGG